jgi:hypothetical protein
VYQQCSNSGWSTVTHGENDEIDLRVRFKQVLAVGILTVRPHLQGIIEVLTIFPSRGRVIDGGRYSMMLAMVW